MLKRPLAFRGGIRLAHHKYESAHSPIASAPLPERLILPLRQSAGRAPEPIVREGDRVKKGDRIAAAEEWISASLHAPTSGTVRAIGPFPVAHPSGLSAPAIVIEADGADEWGEKTPLLDSPARSAANRAALSPEETQRFLQNMGVVGLGGAVFPSHVKLSRAPNTPLQTLIINGAECEPFITCDDRLMRERADDVISGTLFLRDLLEVKETLIAVENNKPEAADALRAALARADAAREIRDVAVMELPAIYPAGSIKQLIFALTGKRAPAHVLPTALGVQCFNAATVYCVWRAVAHGEPVTHRVVTLTGNVEHPGNMEVPLGMPMGQLLALARPRPETDACIVGGPMMGFLLTDERAPVVKGSNCLIARSDAFFPPLEPETSCIRCTSCAQVCPQGLQPYELYWWSRAKNSEKAARYQLMECIECGCCAYVCPAHIPLVQYFRFAKGEVRAAEKAQDMAARAKERFEFRQLRAEREKAERAEKLARAAALQAEKLALAAVTDTDSPANAQTPTTENAP
ncbi:MAG: electron transport complex subunit RsxC [Zoogloeaceae bacterium]|jgi:electron transport complex protein RnfC|nr:electron transport complex subunit RsxC [Zoogloeaceae bacterium]